MRSMLQTFACIGVSALLLAGCGANNGVSTKNVNRANVIHQGNKVKQNAVNQFNNLTGANNRNRGVNTGPNTGRYNTSSNAANNINSHTLQLGNWLRIVGTDGRSGTNMNASSTGNGRNGNRAKGIDSFGEQNPDHVVMKTVNDPKAIQAIDRINRILSNKTNLSSKSDTLLKDLSYVLQSAQKSSNASGKVQGMSVGRHGHH